MIEIHARILQFGEVQSGTSRNGNPYRKCEVVFAHSFRIGKDGQQTYETIVLSLLNEKIDEVTNIAPNTLLLVQFFSNTREYNGRIFNDFNVYKIQPAVMNQQPNPQQYMTQQPPMQNLQQSMYAQPMYAPQPQMNAPFQGQPQGGFVAPQGTVQPTAQQQGMAQTGGGAPVGDMPF